MSTQAQKAMIDHQALTQGLSAGSAATVPDGAPPAGSPLAGAPPFASPERLLGVLTGWQPLHVVATALDLGVFTQIARGAVDRGELLERTGASERGLDMLLNGLASLGYVLRERPDDGARYGLAPDAAAFLVEDSPMYLGGYIRFSARVLTEQWRGLTESVRSGRPPKSIEEPADAAAYWAGLVDDLAPWNQPLAMQVAGRLRELHPGAARMVDVAAGAGVWGIAAAQANPELAVVAIDLPPVLEHARRNISLHGLDERIELVGADIRSYDFGTERYDIAALGQICHCEGAEHSRRLICNVAQAMRPGGTIVIADMLPDEERSGTVFTLMQALSMLVLTEAGDTFTFSEYERWLHEAGCEDVRPFDAMGQTIVFATRAH
jgi:SAM-dependent methyltransferase